MDHTEKGWFITYIDRDPEALEKQKVSSFIAIINPVPDQNNPYLLIAVFIIN